MLFDKLFYVDKIASELTQWGRETWITSHQLVLLRDLWNVIMAVTAVNDILIIVHTLHVEMKLV